MSAAVIEASRRALAVFVLFVAGVLAVWVALFRVGHPTFVGDSARPDPLAPHRCTVGTALCNAVRPGWTIPVAVAIVVSGVLVAALLHRPRRGRVRDRSG